MSETVMNINTLPETVFKMLQTKTVKVREDKGIVTLIPIKENEDCPLFGFFSEGKLSTEKFMKQKQFEKELEG